MKRLEKVKKETEARAYLNPEIAEAHKNKGIELFKSGDFPGAIKEFDESYHREVMPRLGLQPGHIPEDF